MSDRLPPGRQPYDRLNGLRVGALVGAILGAIAAVPTGLLWLIVPGAAVGGAAGWWYERRRSGRG